MFRFTVFDQQTFAIVRSLLIECTDFERQDRHRGPFAYKVFDFWVADDRAEACHRLQKQLPTQHLLGFSAALAP